MLTKKISSSYNPYLTSILFLLEHVQMISMRSYIHSCSVIWGLSNDNNISNSYYLIIEPLSSIFVEWTH
jgi:hypothetical protein